MEEVNRTERELHDAATTRAETDSARRRAVEGVLLAYGLMKETGDGTSGRISFALRPLCAVTSLLREVKVKRCDVTQPGCPEDSSALGSGALSSTQTPTS